MSKSQLFRCILVSFLIAFIATILSTTAVMIGVEEQTAVDLNYLEPEKMENMSPEETEEYISNLPTKTISGVDKFLYPFQHPQFLLFYFRGVITWFVGLLIATTLTTYLNNRSTLNKRFERDA